MNTYLNMKFAEFLLSLPGAPEVRKCLVDHLFFTLSSLPISQLDDMKYENVVFSFGHGNMGFYKRKRQNYFCIP